MKTAIIVSIAFFFHSLTHQVKAEAPAVSGDVQLLTSPPASVDFGDLESDTKTFFFLEQTGLVVPNNLNVNIVDPGVYQGTITGDVHALAGGELVDSYFLHFDPVGALDTSDPGVFLDGSVTFAAEVIAIITRDVQLDTSEFIGFKSPSTLYPDLQTWPGRGVDAPENAYDLVFLSADRRTVSFQLSARNPGDQMRIIVASQIPEPSSVLLLGLYSMAALLVRHRP